MSFLLVVLVSLVVDDVEELELVDTLGGGDHAEPVTELHLLEELLGPGHPLIISIYSLRVRGRDQEVSYKYLR